MKLHHGCDNPAELLAAIAAGKNGKEGVKKGLHLAPRSLVARNYGKYLITFLLSADIAGAHVGTINKDGNANAKVGNGIEVVLTTDAAVESFMENVTAAEVLCPDGRVATIDINTAEILCVK